MKSIFAILFNDEGGQKERHLNFVKSNLFHVIMHVVRES